MNSSWCCADCRSSFSLHPDFTRWSW